MEEGGGGAENEDGRQRSDGATEGKKRQSHIFEETTFV